MPGNPAGRVKRASRPLSASASAAAVTLWAEDHAEAVVLLPLLVLLCTAGAAFIWWPATAAGVVIFLAALIAVTTAGIGSAGKALRYLRGRRDSRRQALTPADTGQLAAADADDRSDPPAIPEDALPGDPA